MGGVCARAAPTLQSDVYVTGARDDQVPGDSDLVSKD